MVSCSEYLLLYQWAQNYSPFSLLSSSVYLVSCWGLWNIWSWVWFSIVNMNLPGFLYMQLSSLTSTVCCGCCLFFSLSVYVWLLYQKSGVYRCVDFAWVFNLIPQLISRKCLISALTHFSFSRELFGLREFARCLWFLLLVSSFNPWWTDRMQGIISVFLYLLRLSLCPNAWSILEKDP